MEVKKKRVVHAECGKQHVDTGWFAEYNHYKHKCEHCGKYFYDKECAVGVEKD